MKIAEKWTPSKRQSAFNEIVQNKIKLFILLRVNYDFVTLYLRQIAGL